MGRPGGAQASEAPHRGRPLTPCSVGPAYSMLLLTALLPSPGRMHNKEVKIISQEELPAQGKYNQPACGWPSLSRDPPQGSLGSDLQLPFPVPPLPAAGLLGLGILSVPPPVRQTPRAPVVPLRAPRRASSGLCPVFPMELLLCLRDKNGS